MSLTSAMLVGFSGVNSNSVGVDTVGDNLANLNTTAFKGQRTLFETLLYRTITEGEAPSDQSGGTLPEQVGMGSTVSSIQRDFRQGGIEGTGFASDLAIDGDGFFVLRRGDGEQVFTRDGSFRLDATQTLVSADGAPVQVFPADGAGVIDQGTLTDLLIPLGSASQAIPTTQVTLEGRLDPLTDVATQGAVVTSQPLISSAGAAATMTTPLTDLVNADGVPLFGAGDVVTLHGSKGGVAVPEATFVVGTTGATVGELADFLQAVLGINADPATGGTPGVSVGDGTVFPAGTLVIRSNLGSVNAVEMDAGSITNTTGAVTSPFSFSTVTPAEGGGATTSFNVFDSLGNPVNVRLRLVQESGSDAGITWRFYAESTDDTDLSPVLGTGTLTFDANGQFVGATGTDLNIDRAASGAVTPLSFPLDFTGVTGLASAQGDSEVVMASQDGAPSGILTNYAIDDEGVVTGTFSNQQTEILGQIALATFANSEGLVALSENTFSIGPNSGSANVLAPRTGTAGAVRSGALEQSNVEIAREFINLISAATGISSSSRVIRVADDLLEELLLLAR